MHRRGGVREASFWPAPAHEQTRPTQPLPCPECRARGKAGGARIGNRRNWCTTCNTFAQNVMRLTRKRLKEKYAEEYARLQVEVEMDLYPQVIEEWSARHPAADQDSPG